MSEVIKKGWKGSLWHETESVIHRKGSITNNETGEKRYIAICESKNNEGKIKFEIMMSLGLVYQNAPEQKFSNSTPDIGGKITLDTEEWKFGGWKNESEKGTPYTNVSLAELQKKEDVPF
tara:strand:+ start:10 stop:369 length:360 start_codon:yes stop_codon:yes gene_type:complete